MAKLKIKKVNDPYIKLNENWIINVERLKTKGDENVFHLKMHGKEGFRGLILKNLRELFEGYYYEFVVIPILQPSEIPFGIVTTSVVVIIPKKLSSRTFLWFLQKKFKYYEN